MSDPSPFTLQLPASAAVPILVDSPHSGMQWPADFDPAAPRDAILTTWDAYVDELWSGAPSAGALLLLAHAPRAYVDTNRAPDDIDPAMLASPWPSPLAPTAYTQRGMGLLRRHALPNVPMYDRLLAVAEVQHRLEAYYTPYRDTLRAQLAALHAAFGTVWHINAHSMKSTGNAMNVDHGAARPDVVVSDRHGTTASPTHTAWVADWFRAAGFTTQVNDPYQGGNLVALTGDPASRRHSIQIEFNRRLYMHEATCTRAEGLAALTATCSAFARDLAAYIESDASAR
jgi:N-formylglutamate deformylase